MFVMHAFHAHLYFSVAEIKFASQVRDDIAQALPYLTYIGQPIPMLVGPHSQPMFEMHIPATKIEHATTILNDLRAGFSVLIHPVQLDELAAHTDEAVWLGEKLALKREALYARH